MLINKDDIYAKINIIFRKEKIMWFDKQPLWLRIVLLIPSWGWITSALYRIVKCCTGKMNVVTLVVGILCIIIPPVGFVMAIIDLVTTITNGKISILVD